MNLVRLCIVSLILYSCNTTPIKTTAAVSSYNDWAITDSTVQFHTYTAHNLLDSTLKKTFLFHDGKISMVLIDLILRNYDKAGNLTLEQSFQLRNNHKKELSGEIINKYDDKNNVVLSTDKFQGYVYSIIQKSFNDKNQEIKRIEIRKLPDEITGYENMDSAADHFHDKRIIHYDTLIYYNYFNGAGDLIREKMERRDKVNETIYKYNGRKKVASFSINSVGDTLNLAVFIEDGIYVKKISVSNSNLFSDTTWFIGNNAFKKVNHSLAPAHLFKQKRIYNFNKKGHEILSVSYR